jgi:hypothetical protein
MDTQPDRQPLHQVVIATAHSYRVGCDAQGHETFLMLIQGLDELLNGPVNHPECHEITQLLPHILAAQGRGDTLALADLLEHELAPRLPAKAA